MIQLHITETGKGYSPKDNYTILNEQTKTFPDIAAAESWLVEIYGKCKRSKMYVDTKDGDSIHCGYVYGFRNSDISHVPVDKWLQQDWITFYSVNAIDLATR